MIFSLAIYGAPYTSQASDTAYRFACAALENKHRIHRIFFYHDGAYNGSLLITPPQDSLNLLGIWQQLGKDHHIDLVVCIAAAMSRGILNKEESLRYNQPAFNLAEGFDLSGLGQLADAMVNSERIITFGN
jgi:tRNA 2-thiouridine synthesizing protein D